MGSVAEIAGGLRRGVAMTEGDPSQHPRAGQCGPSERALARTTHRASVCTVALLVALLGYVGSAAAQGGLVKNGAFVLGPPNAADDWSTEAWAPSAGTTFSILRLPDGMGVAVVQNPQPNDARWMQTVPVEPATWYRLSGFVRALDVPETDFGASLSLLDAFVHSRPLKGKDSGWKAASLWFKTDPSQTAVRIGCRLGHFGQTSSGQAQCTGIELTPQKRPPMNADFVFGPAEESTTPVGVPAALAMVLLLGLGMARYGRVPATVPWREVLTLYGILIAILIVKLVAAPYFKYGVDVSSYSAWALKLANEGPARFYAPGYFADYPPGYMYALWGVGLASDVFRIPWSSGGFIALLKLPALLADFAIAILLFARLRGSGARLAWIAALSFALNPALVLNSAVWGQTDSVLGLLLLLAFLAQGERRFELAWAFAAVAVLTKPQALLLAPLLVLWPRGWWKSGRALAVLLVVVSAVFVIADPFRGDRSWRWLYDLYGSTAGYYAETSANAMNLPALVFGMRQPDNVLLLGLTRQYWGFILGFAVGLGFLAAYARRRSRTIYTALIAGAALVSFVCLTRMHERYLYPFFVFAGLLGVTGRYGILYWAMSALFFANQLVVYLYQSNATSGPEWVWMPVAVLITLGMLAWLALTWLTARNAIAPPAAQALDEDDRAWEYELVKTPPARPVSVAQPAPVRALDWTMREVAGLAAVVLIGFGLRFYNLGQPTDLVFDEVYFVEQARSYILGRSFMDPHPPLAKLSIAAGMLLVGDTPTGWRIVNALVGTALIPLVYILARVLFRRRFASFAAAVMVATDGLFLVDSRIAVIDIHYVTWAVVAYILTLVAIQKRQLQSTGRLVAIGIAIGLSVGAKLFIPFFSFLLVIGAIAVACFNQAREEKVSIFRTGLKPILVVGWTAFAVYCLVFSPHYLWGWWHSPLDLVKYVFIDTPGYQSAVRDATHPYSSKWWTWPLLLRPVWYFWKDPGPIPGTVVGIWGSGNPPVWWAALPALGFITYHWIRERSFSLGFVVVGWLIHLAPWVPISRTLFLYHYLPSLLFAMLALAWLLDRLWEGEGSTVERGIAGAAVLASLLPVTIAVIPAWGPVVFAVFLLTFEGLLFSGRSDPVRVGRLAVGAFCIASLAISWYFLPIWIGMPLSKAAWEARMWISGSGIMNWI